MGFIQVKSILLSLQAEQYSKSSVREDNKFQLAKVWPHVGWWRWQPSADGILPDPKGAGSDG